MRKIFISVLLAFAVLALSAFPAFAQSASAVAAEGDVMPRSDGFEWHYMVDEDGRLMRRLWSVAKEMYVTDWEYV